MRKLFRNHYFLFSLILALTVASYCVWKYVPLSKEDTNKDLLLYGNVDIRQLDLSFRVFGKIERLFVDEGEVVRKGQLLAELDPEPYLDIVTKAKKAVQRYVVEVENANKILQRREGLPFSGAISEEQYEEALYRSRLFSAGLEEQQAALKIAERNAEDHRLIAPQEGIVLSRIREEGSVVSAGESVFSIALSSPMWVRAYVAEPNLGNIALGMEAVIYTDTKAIPPQKGRIGFISPLAEFTPKNVETSELRTDLVYRLRIIVDEPHQGLLQGMPVTIRLIPHSALLSAQCGIDL